MVIDQISLLTHRDFETCVLPLARLGVQLILLGDPASQLLTFIDRAQASPALTPSFLQARTHTSISQTPHFYWPSPHGKLMAILGHTHKSFSGLRLRLAPVCRYKTPP